MDNSSGKTTCAITCWGIAALFGVVIAAVLMSVGGWMFMQGAFIGVLGFVVLGAVLSLSLCRDLPHPSQVRAVTAPPAPTVKSSGTPSVAEASATATAAAAPAKAAPKPAPAAPASAKPAPAAEGDGAKPAVLSGPRDGGADDLKKIKGIGPKLEKACNEAGVYHYDQIAAWTEEEVQWMDNNLVGFKGRVTRDDWVAQAKLLASGGETEFSKKVDKGGVY